MVDRIRDSWDTTPSTRTSEGGEREESWCVPPALPSIASTGQAEEDAEVPQPSPGWIESFEELVREVATLAQAKQMEMMQRQISILSKRVHDLDAVNSTIVPIQSFGPEPYATLKDIRIVLQQNDEGFTATLYDANLSMCGETEVAAIEGLKGLIVHVYEVLEKQPKLGPGPRRQLAVLRSLIARTK